MTETTASGQQIAHDYVRAWLRGDVETALSLIAEDIVCEAPNGVINGRAAYRELLTPFASALLSSELIDVLAEDAHAATAYRVETPFAKDYCGMEYLTVQDGKITRAISVFDLSPMIAA
jgi:ketosteroid isomerase-like protein